MAARDQASKTAPAIYRKKEERNERVDKPVRRDFGQRRRVAARVELAGRRFARLRLGGVNNLSRQIARAAPSGLVARFDRRRLDADSGRRCSKPAAATTEQQSAELRGRASTDRRYERRRADGSKPAPGFKC